MRDVRIVLMRLGYESGVSRQRYQTGTRSWAPPHPHLCGE